MRPAQLVAILEREFTSIAAGHHTPVMLWGPPGVGKSRIVAQIAARHGVALVDVRLSQMEPSDLRGIPFRVERRVEWAPPAMLPDATRHGASGILFLDEITSAPPSVSAAAYQLILDRRLGEYEVPSGWAIFAAGNRQGDRGVTYTMPAPLANRFTHFEVEPHLDDWVAWAYAQGIDARVIGYLRFRPERLFEFDPARAHQAFPTPRSWEFAHHALRKFESTPDLLSPALQACVGSAAGVELAAFIALAEKLPDVDAIARGEKVPLPREIDVQYAVVTALVARALRAQGQPDAAVVLSNIVAYAGAFAQRELGVMLVHDLARSLGRAVYDTPEFSLWAKDVANILL